MAARENLYTAIVFYPVQRDLVTGKILKSKAAKYHNVEADKTGSWARFVNFVSRKFPGATAVNLYGGVTEEFIRQVRL